MLSTAAWKVIHINQQAIKNKSFSEKSLYLPPSYSSAVIFSRYSLLYLCKLEELLETPNLERSLYLEEHGLKSTINISVNVLILTGDKK